MNTTTRLCCVAVIACLGLHTAHGQPQDLWTAIERGELTAVEAYLIAGGDANASARPPPSDLPDGLALQEAPAWPLLQIAIYDREEEIALALLEAGADFDSLVFDGLGAPIGVVASGGMARILQYLIEENPRRLLDAPPIVRSGILQGSVSNGYQQSIEVALAEAQRIGLRWDSTVLADAAALALADRHDHIARMLFAAGAPIKDSTIRLAARSSSPGMVRFLLGLGADPNSRLAEEFVDKWINARTAMDYAWVRYRRLPERQQIAQFVMFELWRGGAAFSEGQSADVPLDGLAYLESFVDPERRLVAAASFGFFESVVELVETYEPGRAAMREAATVALGALHNDIANFLLGAGAPVDSGPLHAAAGGNSPGLVRDLLARGADPNERVDGESPAENWWARYRERDFGAAGDFVLHELINGGADVCWLVEYYDELNIFAAGFLRHTATHCWSD